MMPTTYTAHTSGSSRDTLIAEVLELAKAGDPAARETLLGWAYQTANDYYLAKVDVESDLTRKDAEDLAGAFIVEFYRAWPRVSTVCHYTRRMLRNNLNRYLRRKKERLSREAPLGGQVVTHLVMDAAASTPEYAHDRWSDEDRIRHLAVSRIMDSCDETTRELMKLRAAEAGYSYREISDSLGITEAALRMRATRFYRLVRQEHWRLTSGARPDS